MKREICKLDDVMNAYYDYIDKGIEEFIDLVVKIRVEELTNDDEKFASELEHLKAKLKELNFFDDIMDQRKNLLIYLGKNADRRQKLTRKEQSVVVINGSDFDGDTYNTNYFYLCPQILICKDIKKNKIGFDKLLNFDPIKFSKTELDCYKMKVFLNYIENALGKFIYENYMEKSNKILNKSKRELYKLEVEKKYKKFKEKLNSLKNYYDRATEKFALINEK